MVFQLWEPDTPEGIDERLIPPALFAAPIANRVLTKPARKRPRAEFQTANMVNSL
jgi:hypothetical protein